MNIFNKFLYVSVVLLGAITINLWVDNLLQQARIMYIKF